MADFLAVYGTLRRGGRLHHYLGVDAHRSALVGTATVAGRLYEVEPTWRDASVDTSYPCLIDDRTGRVVVELFRIIDPTLWVDLDELEGYLPHDLDNSEYHRRVVALADVRPSTHLATPLTEAFTYVYVARPPHPDHLIKSGDWMQR